MAQPPVIDADFEVVKRRRRIPRRALWFAVAINTIWIIVANETHQISTLVALGYLAAFTYPILGWYFPFVDRTWGASALDFHRRPAIDRESALKYEAQKRPAEVWGTFVFAPIVAYNIPPEASEGEPLWRMAAVVATVALWPIFRWFSDYVGRLRQRTGNHEPLIENWVPLMTATLAFTGLFAFLLITDSSAPAKRSTTNQTPQTASTTGAP